MELPHSAGTYTFNIVTRQVLMIKVQSPGTKKIYWTFPKGLIEDHETPKDAAIRETYEETGIRCTILRKVDEFEIYRMYRNVRFHKKITMFVAVTKDMHPKPSNEVLDAKFVDFDKALVALKQHEADYIPGLLKSLVIVAHKFPNIYKI